MSKVNFNVNAYTARLIGRENVATLNGAILELVKNTYDADSSICILYYDDIDDNVYLIDNGCGMTENIIINHWMTIGRSTKRNKYISKKGRVQTGAKGIGRFALDRIADFCEMLTINDNEKLLWKVNWKDFEGDNNITDITAELDKTDINIKEFLKDVHNDYVNQLINNVEFETGTIFKLSGLRDKWSEARINKIMDNLRSLIPVNISKQFKIYTFCNKFNIDEAEVLVNAEDFNYDYKITFKVTSDRALVSIYRNEFDLINEFDKINMTLKEHNFEGFSEVDKKYFDSVPIEYNLNVAEMLPGFNEGFAGDFDGELYFAKLNTTKKDKEKYFYRYPSPKKVNEIFTGIKLYRDSFRVRPYGEYNTSSYDWLLLDRKKARSPAAITGKGSWKVRCDQIFGVINISRTNDNLMDQSNREGIVETKEFLALKETICYVISLFEIDRQYVFRNLREYNNIIEETERLENQIAEIAKQELKNEEESGKVNISTSQPVLNVAVSAVDAQKVIDKKNEEIKDLIDENILLMTLATTGIVTNTYIHELKALTLLLGSKTRTALNALNRNDLDICKKALKDSYNVRKSLNSWFEITINSLRKNKRKKQKIDIVDHLENLFKNWNELLAPKGISLVLESIDSTVMFNCFPYEIETILNNLITNSIASFDKEDSINKEIKVKINLDTELEIEYEDNGLGLSEEYKKNPYRILNQFETDRRDEFGELIGTGMGMGIIKSIIDGYGGSIDLAENKSIERGFKAKIYLKGDV